jgi:hypothetical protein
MALLNEPRKLIFCAQTCPVRPSGHADGADRLEKILYITVKLYLTNESSSTESITELKIIVRSTYV